MQLHCHGRQARVLLQEVRRRARQGKGRAPEEGRAGRQRRRDERRSSADRRLADGRSVRCRDGEPLRDNEARGGGEEAYRVHGSWDW